MGNFTISGLHIHEMPYGQKLDISEAELETTHHYLPYGLMDELT
jgi:MOSC domain-containing protein YiiM